MEFFGAVPVFLHVEPGEPEPGAAQRERPEGRFDFRVVGALFMDLWRARRPAGSARGAGRHTPARGARPRRARGLVFPKGSVDPARPALCARRGRRPETHPGNASARIATYCAVHSPMPRTRRNAATASSTVAPGPKLRSPRSAAFANSCKATARARGSPMAAISAGLAAASAAADGASRFKCWNGVETGRPNFSRESSRQGGGSRHAHLLAQHGPHRQLKGRPGARHPQPGMPPHARRRAAGPRRVARPRGPDSHPGRTAREAG